ncbi:MAG TPA: 30S ribosomal protein S6 [Chitinophagaceae bacterium]|nr:MAG: 30S ribosomal protein S6 [Bacteroidetes bacterium OLB11]HMN32258.1 30S ribosomal protein S6 [Chitinophagaceae bacterium]
MNNYELMVIYTPILSNDEFKAATKNLKKFITDNGGEIVGDNPWGLKSFAYPIDKKTTGLYYVLEFKAAPSFNSKLQIQMSRDESIMRTLLTALDKHAVAYNARKRNGESTNVKSNSLTENTEA